MANVYGNGTTTASAGANTVTHYYDKAGVKAANETNIYVQMADRKSMPLKMGKTFKISKFLHIYDRAEDHADFGKFGYLSSRGLDDVANELAATNGTGASLLEGSGATNERGISKITMEASFSRYGEMISYTDEVDIWSEDYIQVRYREELGRLANMRMEDLVQKDMLSTPNKMYANDELLISDLGTGILADDTNASSFKTSFDLIRKAAKKLTRNRAEKTTSIVDGSTKIDTKTVNKAFYGIVGPEIKYDLESLTRGAGSEAEFAFVPVYKYAAAGKLANGEVGQMHDVRFIESETALVRKAAGAYVPQNYVGALSSSGAATDNTDATETNRDKFDVFPILFPTKGSFATIGLKGHGKIKFGSQDPSKLENANPYGTKGFFSYSFFYSGIILNETTLLEVDVLATA